MRTKGLDFQPKLVTSDDILTVWDQKILKAYLLL